MSRVPATVAVLLFLWTGSSEAQQEQVAERWRFNSRAQTKEGLQALSANELETAVDHFGSARRLDPDNPVTVFNDLTVRLLAGHPEAVSEFRDAVATLPPELASEAHYNLGNALLEQGDPAAAIESYKSALRLGPGLFDAKFNLELARRLLEEQQDRQRSQNGQQSEQSGEEQQDDEQEETTRQERSATDGPREEEQQEKSDDTEAESQPDGAPDHEGDEDHEPERQSPLPEFEEQQDMTAEQAAAILEAIENLERDQRRRQAEERARRRALEGKDW